VNLQGSQPGVHFDLMRIGKKKTPVGFAHYAIDQGGTGGLTEPGGGVFRGYYVAPGYRRRGYGRRMFLHCAETLYKEGARYLCCCPDPVTGEPFWRAMGFEDSGVPHPGDRLNIFIKKRPGPAGVECRAVRREDLHTGMMDGFDWYQEITHEARENGRVKKLRRPRVNQNSADDNVNFIKYWFIGTVAVQEFYHGCDETFAAFSDGRVLGFAALLGHPLGKDGNLANLTHLYIRYDCRRMGLGKQLFLLAAEAARAAGMQKLVISAERAVESQAFYRAMGCVPMAKDRKLRGEIRGGRTGILMQYTL
jgi:GNAT superfamily N-acetyltransferase